MPSCLRPTWRGNEKSSDRWSSHLDVRRRFCFFRLPLLIGDLLVRSFGRCFVGGQVAARSRSSVTHQKKRIRSFNDIVRYLTDKGEGRAANRPTDGLPFDFLFIGPRGPCHRRPAIH